MRLFVAVWPDEATRRLLSGLERELGGSRGLRFVGPSRWHVTLRYLGDVDVPVDGDPAHAPALGRISDSLRACCGAITGPIECRLGPGTGWFTGVRVLQLPASGLDGLAAAVRVATLPVVPEPIGASPFNGHLSLARARGRRLSVAALGEMAGIPFEASFPVHGVDLVASEPSANGHVYTTVAQAPLGPSG